jgi:hypothetical protein
VDGLRTIGRPEPATFVLAVLRGLIMDLEATADTGRVDRAFADLLTSLRTAGPAASAVVRIGDGPAAVSS